MLSKSVLEDIRSRVDKGQVLIVELHRLFDHIDDITAQLFSTPAPSIPNPKDFLKSLDLENNTTGLEDGQELGV